MSELVETSTKAEPRSTRRRRLRPIRLLVILLAIVAVGFGGYALFWRYHLKRFDTVRPGVLYRSAQPT